MCKTRILSSRDQTIVSGCMGCGTFYLWHNNLLINFSAEAFQEFRKMVNELPFYKNSLPFPDEEERVIVHTPHEDICFAFDYEEFELFKMAIDEALYMNEVYTLMRQ